MNNKYALISLVRRESFIVVDAMMVKGWGTKIWIIFPFLREQFLKDVDSLYLLQEHCCSALFFCCFFAKAKK